MPLRAGDADRQWKTPAVAILMGCYNGAQYLPMQLASIEAQSMKDWILLASDDGSTDNTLLELARFREHVGRAQVEIRQGPCRGYVANFLSMACQPDVNAPYFAFSDQDDLWLPDKLARALEALSEYDDRPAVYCSRTTLVNDAGETLCLSPLFRRPPCFRNALVQSVAGGNTMVFNDKARQLLLLAGSDVHIASHDWWLYMLVTGAGGVILYDAEPSLEYRQHGGNLIGGNMGLQAKWRRLVKMLDGQLKVWNEMHCKVLAQNLSILTQENRLVFEKFKQCRTQGRLQCLSGLIEAGIFRQTFMGNLGLYVAALSEKV